MPARFSHTLPGQVLADGGDERVHSVFDGEDGENAEAAFQAGGGRTKLSGVEVLSVQGEGDRARAQQPEDLDLLLDRRDAASLFLVPFEEDAPPGVLEGHAPRAARHDELPAPPPGPGAERALR